MTEGLIADGVFSGGGVKAIAFAGALKATEEAGYGQWLQLAGTSAGAITAAALAAGYNADQLTERLMSPELAAIADIGRPRRLAGMRNLVSRRALARGLHLHRWVAELLSRAPNPVHTFGELDGRLRVVATDLVHRRMVVLPDDAPRYLDGQGRPWDPDRLPVATAVRMSAGYPFMFPPVPMRDAVTGRPGALVDGGIVSGFPVFLFDRKEPCQPTWGFRLTDERTGPGPRIGGADWAVDMIRAILETSINVHDTLAADAYAQRTIVIPTGAAPTLEFNLSMDQKRALWQAGHDAASAFFAANPRPRNIFGHAPPAEALAAPLP